MEVLAVIAVIAAVLILSMVWHFGRSDSLLVRWAAQHGYRIISQDYRWFMKGPFFWTSTKNQSVYYVVVQDPQGNIRKGWVLCGGWWLGLLSDHVEVQWDE